MNTRSRPAIFDLMTALADALRSRILLLLEERELTVSELCAVLQLPQSTVSRHLKVLAGAGLAVSRRNGTHRLYSMPQSDGDAESARMWEMIRRRVEDSPASRQDRRRLRSVLAERQSRSREFFSASADHWDQMRDELFGERFLPAGLLGLLDDRWVVGDLGCGTGRLSEILAPHVARVVAVDGSREMLRAAKQRLDDLPNVELRRGDLERLPIPERNLDAAVLALVLHHLPDPGRVVREVAGAIRPDGRLVLIDMLPHDRVDYQADMGHVWLGFSEREIRTLLGSAGFDNVRFLELPIDPKAKGPSLFLATARNVHSRERSVRR